MLDGREKEVEARSASMPASSNADMVSYIEKAVRSLLDNHASLPPPSLYLDQGQDSRGYLGPILLVFTHSLEASFRA